MSCCLAQDFTRAEKSRWKNEKLCIAQELRKEALRGGEEKLHYRLCFRPNTGNVPPKLTLESYPPDWNLQSGTWHTLTIEKSQKMQVLGLPHHYISPSSPRGNTSTFPASTVPRFQIHLSTRLVVSTVYCSRLPCTYPRHNLLLCQAKLFSPKLQVSTHKLAFKPEPMNPQF